MTHVLISADIRIFHQKFSLNREIKIKIAFSCVICDFLTNIEFSKIVLISVIAILIMSAKLLTPYLLKTTLL